MATSTQTKPKTHQQQLARLQQEVQALREQLRGAQRLATVGTMTAMVAHEFNNILTPIINYARMARDNPKLVEKALRSVADGGTRAADICRALLDVTRNSPPEPETVVLRELISETFDAMARKPAKDAIEVELDVPAGMQVTTRVSELQQVLLNLLMNARAAVMDVPPPRRIEISARRTETHTIIRVRDTGGGIPPEDLEKIFHPFFTTKSEAQGDSQGHGLGLAFCREIMAELAGEISVASTVGEGTTFTLHLPH